ncbi:MAG: response regulator [Acidimicrobiia bacterium]|nr:response regulator [Acidimicrobiia bacterium]
MPREVWPAGPVDMLDETNGAQWPETERMLRAAVESAEQASRAKSQFLAEISHEIRTQLAGILGMAQVSLETKLTPQQREYVELITTSAEALLTLVNDLLDLSKIEAGHLAVEEISFNLRDNLRDTVTSMMVAAEEKGINLEVEFSDDLPGNVIGDPGRLRQIVINLIGNAVKFTDVGSVVVSVRAEPSDSAKVSIHVEVTDTGSGIPADQLDSIFDRYEQVGRPKGEQTVGTGLGLTISRQLVEIMGGEIWAESELGNGSTFHVTLPLAPTDAEMGLPPSRGRSDLEGLPILIVADNQVNQSKLLNSISATGMQPTAVTGLDEALSVLSTARLDDRPFALTICDLNGDGMEFARKLRTDDDLAAMHVIVLTAIGQRGDAAMCRDLNIAGYLTKPIPAEDVRGAVEAVINGPSPLDLTVLVTKHWLRERRRHLNILVVDDSPTHRMVAKRILERRGHRISAAGSGREAIEAVQTHRFDIILLDLWMPGMGGFETAAAIRVNEDRAERVPIIAMSAETVSELNESLAEAGMDGLIAKPFQVPQLLRTIEHLIEDE